MKLFPLKTKKCVVWASDKILWLYLQLYLTDFNSLTSVFLQSLVPNSIQPKKQIPFRLLKKFSDVYVSKSFEEPLT